MTYHLKVAGLERELPLCKVDDSMTIAAFVIFGDVELTCAAAAALLETLAGMCERLGQTVVMVTHDEQAAATTNRIIRLRDGRITGVEAVRRPAGTRVAGSSARHAAGPSPAAGPAPRMEAR